MGLEGQLERLSPLIESLMDSTDARARQRMILDAVVELGIARGGALWSEFGPRPEFQLLTSVGAPDCCPSAELVAAVARGDFARDAIPGQTLLLAGRAPRRLALSLTELVDREQWEDMLEAVLILSWQLDRPSALEAPLDLIDTLLAPFRQELGATPGELGAELDSLLTLMGDTPDEESGESDAA